VRVETLRHLASIHGALAWLCVAALAAAAVYLTRRRTRAPQPLALILASAATLLVVVTFALGMLLHEPYQQRLRHRIFVKSPSLGWLFERKEHLAFGALTLSLCALVALAALSIRERRLGSPSSTVDPISKNLIAAAFRSYIASALLAVAACIASALVAREHGF
jgi:hypothetical protein